MLSLRLCQMRLRFLHSSVVQRATSTKQFIVRRLQTAEEVEIIVSKAAAVGWKPGALDHFSYFAADNTGFFVGELKGEVISCISAVKYSNKYAFLGHFIVDKPYRGRGYGVATRTVALSSLPEGCNIALDVFEDEVLQHGRPLGTQPTWRNQYVTIPAGEGNLALANAQYQQETAILPASDLQFSDLIVYDTSIHGYSRPLFLKQWISAPNCFAYVATHKNGSVVGYTVVRTVFGQDGEWRVGPLLADNSQIAIGLYKAIFEKISAEDADATIMVDVPFGGLPNPDALGIIKQLPARLSDTIITRMHKYGVPSDLRLHKIFALTSTAI